MRKNWKKITGIAIAAIMTATTLAGCSSKESEPKEETKQEENNNSGEKSDTEVSDSEELKGSGETLVIGVQPISFCYPVIYASEKGYFEDAGLNVEYIIFETGSSMNEGLAAQQVDIGVNGLATIYTVSGGVCDLIAESESPVDGADGSIYARPDSEIAKAKELDGMLGSRETLEGVTCLGATSTLNQQQAYAYMDKFGLKAGKDFEFLNMDYSTANQAFLAGEGDIISVSGLNYMDELEEAGMVEICDYAIATGGPYRSGIVARRDITEERADDIALFLRVFYETTEELNNDMDTYREGYLEYVLENGRDYTAETAAAEIEARPLFTKESMTADDYELGTSTIAATKFFVEIGVIEEANLENMKNINPSFLNKALDLDVKVAPVE